MELHFTDLKECTLMAKRGKLHLRRVNQILLGKVVIKKGATTGSQLHCHSHALYLDPPIRITENLS